MAWIYFEPDAFEGIVFPPAVQAMGWGIELFPLSIVIFTTIYVMIKRKRNGKSIAFVRVGPMMTPTPGWGPRSDQGPPLPSKDDVSYDNSSFSED